MNEKKPNDNTINPENIHCLKNITIDSYALMGLDNSICIFKSINEILYLIFSDINLSIICFDLNDDKKIIEIRNAHNNDITNYRHCLDKKHKRDLLLSLSFEDNNIKIWQVNDWRCLADLQNVYTAGYLKSSCFLNDTNDIYIITSNSGETDLIGPIKIYDLNGNYIKEMKDSNDDTIFIDTFYDNKISKYFIITGNNGYIKTHNYISNDLYLIYKDSKNVYDHTSIIAYNDEDGAKIIESCGDGNIRIWDFHSTNLIKKIKASNGFIYSICLWDNNHLFVACRDKKIKLISLEEEIIKKELPGYNKDVVTIKIVNHCQYGKCLLSKGKYDEVIKIWII